MRKREGGLARSMEIKKHHVTGVEYNFVRCKLNRPPPSYKNMSSLISSNAFNSRLNKSSLHPEHTELPYNLYKEKHALQMDTQNTQKQIKNTAPAPPRCPNKKNIKKYKLRNPHKNNLLPKCPFTSLYNFSKLIEQDAPSCSPVYAPVQGDPNNTRTASFRGFPSEVLRASKALGASFTEPWPLRIQWYDDAHQLWSPPIFCCHSKGGTPSWKRWRNIECSASAL